MISIGNIPWDSEIVPAEQYETSVNAEVERHLAVLFIMGSQFPAMGLHCTKRITTNAELELTKRTIVA